MKRGGWYGISYSRGPWVKRGGWYGINYCVCELLKTVTILQCHPVLHHHVFPACASPGFGGLSPMASPGFGPYVSRIWAICQQGLGPMPSTCASYYPSLRMSPHESTPSPMYTMVLTAPHKST